MIEIKKVAKEDYPNGKKVTYSYTSDKYYDVLYHEDENGWKIHFSINHFETPFHKHREGKLFEDDLENLECYIAELNGEEVGIVSISHEKWNNVLRINEIHIQQSLQLKGIGGQLMNMVKERGAKLGVRAIVLETQTSNFPAIQFYKKHGFNFIGCNLFGYSNDDVEQKEVRIEMGFIFRTGTV
jgi:ribosomal protein S18 acetylase RimI-like enzyme